MVNVVKSSSFLDSHQDRYTVYFTKDEYRFLIECLSDFQIIFESLDFDLIRLKADAYKLKKLKVFLSVLVQML